MGSRWPRGIALALGALCLGVLASPVARPALAAPTARAGLDPRLERAAAALRQGEVEAALRSLEALRADAPENARALSLYAQALLVAGRFREAADALDRLRELDPQAERLDYFRGLAAYRLEEWPQARGLLERALAQQPDSGVLHLLHAVALQETGELGAAEAALARAVALDPKLAGQVDYRRGISAVRAGRLGAASRHFAGVEPALPGSALARSAESFQDWLAGSRGGRALSASAGLGSGYDSNVNLAADDQALGTDREDAALGILELGLGYRLLQTESLRVDLGQRGGFRFHFGESDFDLAESRTSAGASYQALPWLRASLAYAFEYLAADYQTFRLTHVVEPSLRIAPFEAHPTRVFVRVEPRSYDERPANRNLDRDGIVYRAGFDQTFALPDWWGFGRNFVRLGYQLRGETADGRDFDSLGHVPSLTLGVALPLGAQAVLDLRNEWRGHANPSSLCAPTPCSDDRDDSITELSAGLRKRLGQQLDFELAYRHARRESDAADFFDYRRHIVEFVGSVRY